MDEARLQLLCKRCYSTWKLRACMTTVLTVRWTSTVSLNRCSLEMKVVEVIRGVLLRE